MTQSNENPIELPPSVRREIGQGGLASTIIENAFATAQIYDHGAHVTAFQPRSATYPVLWLSSQSHFEDGKPIRGGVPICFPWFGPRADDAEAPMHGLARTGRWILTQAQENESGTQLTFVPSEELEKEKLWPREAQVSLQVLVGEALELQFNVTAGDESCEYEAALHSYFSVGDARTVEVRGLEGAPYWDKAARGQRGGEKKPLSIKGETDRVYNSASTCVARDTPWQREIVVEKENSGSTIVWNPAEAKARAMADFGDDEWRGMLCIETANVGRHKIELKAGESHTMTARISVRKIAGT
jgi:D-hexose-6-phosphate mutarotase